MRRKLGTGCAVTASCGAIPKKLSRKVPKKALQKNSKKALQKNSKKALQKNSTKKNPCASKRRGQNFSACFINQVSMSKHQFFEIANTNVNKSNYASNSALCSCANLPFAPSSGRRKATTITANASNALTM